VCLAIRDVLCAMAETHRVHYVHPPGESRRLPRCQGDSDLAHGLLDLLEPAPEAIFILTDGYDNAPATRARDIIRALPKIGLDIPVVQITPVMAAEAEGIRLLHQGILSLAVSQVESLAVGLLKLAFHADLQMGANALWEILTTRSSARKLLEESAWN
ncbi:MAG: vWA domain-containing protein, partial [Bacteroidota bacterium]